MTWLGQLSHPSEVKDLDQFGGRPDFTACISVATDADGLPRFGSSNCFYCVGTGKAAETFKQTDCVDLLEVASETSAGHERKPLTYRTKLRQFRTSRGEDATPPC
jgi:hypothetical protein